MTAEEQVVKLLQQTALLKVQQAYGIYTTEDFKEFIGKLKSLYNSIDISQYSSVVAVYRHVAIGSGIRVSIDNVYQYAHDIIMINFLDDGYVEVFQDSINITELSKQSVVYKWCPNNRLSDVFVIKGEEVPFSQDPCSNGLSYFSVKTYKTLEDALIYYRDTLALEAKRKVLCDALRKNRLFFKNAPECLLQEDLYDYLLVSLRDAANVKREHNVDETHPVDISITFKSTNHVALIEIKWVGKSLNAEETDISCDYSDSRANDGAKQLVDYIDANRVSFPSSITAGYLVVYDLRRKNNTDPASDRITRSDGDYYLLKMLKMSPDYKGLRPDYKETYRVFIKVAKNAYKD
jgi:hypothetical protein